MLPQEAEQSSLSKSKVKHRKRAGNSSADDATHELSSRPKRSAVERPASLPLTLEQKALEQNLRDWRKSEAAKTGKPAFIVFGDSVLNNIVHAQPQTINDLLNVNGIGPEKADRYGADIIALCRNTDTSSEVELPAKNEVSSRPERRSSEVERPASQSTLSNSHKSGAPYLAVSSPDVGHRAAARPANPAAVTELTPAQQALDQRLRAWRATEAERLGIPQFFVLGTTTLRSIVLARPQTVDDLRSIEGLTHEKAEQFGPSILTLCNE
jgi:ATP-dependent DNA helicase RecQ